MRSFNSVTAPVASTELLGALSAFLTELPNHIEAAEGLVSYHKQFGDDTEHDRFARIARVLADFRDGLAI
jgi:hypothetical protein